MAGAGAGAAPPDAPISLCIITLAASLSAAALRSLSHTLIRSFSFHPAVYAVSFSLSIPLFLTLHSLFASLFIPLFLSLILLSQYADVLWHHSNWHRASWHLLLPLIAPTTRSCLLLLPTSTPPCALFSFSVVHELISLWFS